MNTSYKINNILIININNTIVYMYQLIYTISLTFNIYLNMYIYIFYFIFFLFIEISYIY